MMHFSHSNFKNIDSKFYALSFFRYGVMLDLGYHRWILGTR